MLAWPTLGTSRVASTPRRSWAGAGRICVSTSWASTARSYANGSTEACSLGELACVGVEEFAAYRNPCWDLYDEVIPTAIERFLESNADTWDAILLLDVLEHFEHALGEAILANFAAGCRLEVGCSSARPLSGWTKELRAATNSNGIAPSGPQTTCGRAVSNCSTTAPSTDSATRCYSVWRRIRRPRPRGPLLACPVRFQANHLKNSFPTDWYLEPPIVYVKGDLQKVAGRVPGGTACCCSESIACDLDERTF
jgi:hypothetical protein